MGARRESNSFIQGCTSLRIKLFELTMTQSYTKQVLLPRSCTTSMSVTLPLAREFIRIKMNAEAVEKLSKLFITCHALAMKSRPFSDFTWQCEIDEKKGLPIGRPTVFDRISAHACVSARYFLKKYLR